MRRYPASLKTTATRSAKPSGLLPLPQYKGLVRGLMDQGLPHDDAVSTLREGLKQANGRAPSSSQNPS